MSAFDWFQSALNLILVSSIVYLLWSQWNLKRGLGKTFRAMNDRRDIDSWLERLRQCELEARRAFDSATKVEKRVDDVARMAEQLDPIDANASREALELRDMAKEKDEIPTLRQIERTRTRVHHESQVDLRTLLREQLS